MTSCKAVLSLSVLLLASVPLVLAEGTYTQIDYPGALETLSFAVNTAGDVVGYYEDASQNFHGFLLSGGIYTSIDGPNSNLTFAFGINDTGQIVGSYRTIGSSIIYGFTYDRATQAFSAYSYPQSEDTNATAINNNGGVVGYAFMLRGTVERWIGFALSGTTFAEIGPTTPGSVYVNGINDSNDAVGFVCSGNSGDVPCYSFLYGGKSEKILSRLDRPQALGINNSGTITGDYRPTVGQTAGFVYQDRVVRELQFPGAEATLAAGINNAGDVCGFIIDSAGATHGFTWTPPADAAKK